MTTTTRIAQDNVKTTCHKCNDCALAMLCDCHAGADDVTDGCTMRPDCKCDVCEADAISIEAL